MSYTDEYRDAIAMLLGPLTSEDGITSEAIQQAEARLGVRIPAALRDYYLVAGQFGALNQAHNRLLPPRDWFVDAGRLVFLEENQAVVFWGVAPGGEDPPVWRGVNPSAGPIEWHREDDSCSNFLLVMIHWQAVCGGLESAGIADISAEEAARFRMTWSLVGRVGDLVAFGRDGRAACIVGGDPYQLYVAARSEEEMETIEAELERFGIGLDRV